MQVAFGGIVATYDFDAEGHRVKRTDVGGNAMGGETGDRPPFPEKIPPRPPTTLHMTRQNRYVKVGVPVPDSLLR